jgi:hypothetical protein
MKGPDIKGQPRSGTAVVYVLTNTTNGIDGGGSKEIRTITRVELITIHTVIATFASND